MARKEKLFQQKKKKDSTKKKRKKKVVRVCGAPSLLRSLTLYYSNLLVYRVMIYMFCFNNLVCFFKNCQVFFFSSSFSSSSQILFVRVRTRFGIDDLDPIYSINWRWGSSFFILGKNVCRPKKKLLSITIVSPSAAKWHY